MKIDKDLKIDKELGDTPLELEEGVKIIIDPLKEVSLGTNEDPMPTYLSTFLEVDEEISNMDILREYRDIFAWIYVEVYGLNCKVAFYQSIKNGAHPVEQIQRHFQPDLVPLIGNEINKLIEVYIICEVKYSIWISSIVHVRKKG
ncbi:hypothetical protein KY290_036614 [Solanum tuberosum]|uniref:Uncharacterized protein n=1 Tax=Solanum tuberosum TaxID=4113 RepID=A0ABQ7TUH4_SOLTU|nr:hypothetical protein KY285_035939 [Solanum tuberosum]KAH0737909.1 hypothetical protein KY290_036614 [Solanum tuberosum]